MSLYVVALSFISGVRGMHDMPAGFADDWLGLMLLLLLLLLLLR
jgi:hypothetical protein